MFMINVGNWNDTGGVSGSRVEELSDVDDVSESNGTPSYQDSGENSRSSDDYSDRSSPNGHPQTSSDYSYLEFSDGYQNFCVSIQAERGAMEQRSICDTWPSMTQDAFPDSIAINFSSAGGMRRNWRDNLRRMSSGNKSSALRLVRGISKNTSIRLTARQRLAGGGLSKEAMLFSVSHSSASLPPSPPSVSRSPRWLSAARRELLRSKKARRRTTHGMTYTPNEGSTPLSPIKEEEDHQNSALSRLEGLNLSPGRCRWRLVNQSRLTNFADHSMGFLNTETCALNISSTPAAPSNFEDELCERMGDLPMTEFDPEPLRQLRESLQACSMAHDET